MTKTGNATLRGEYLLPCLETFDQDVFVGIKTGKEYDKGYLVYVGRDINENDLLQKMKLSKLTTPSASSILESFVQELQNLKIGNVVSISYSGNNRCSLKKEAEHPAIKKQIRNLP